MDEDRACSACAIAFWDAFGMMPDVAAESGYEPVGDLSFSAWSKSIDLSKKLSLAWELPGTMQEVSLAWDMFDEEKSEKDGRRLFREIRMLSPGIFNGYEFTASDIDAFVRNFDPTDYPPILVDHDWKADNIHGYIRSVKVSDGSLFSLWEFIGDYAVERVKDGRWKRVSGGFQVGPTEADKRILEGSIVVKGAYNRGVSDRAEILGKGPEKMENNKEEAAQVELQADPAAVAVTEVTQELAAPAPAQPSADFLARLEALEAENKRLALEKRQSEDEADVLELVRLGKSTPALASKELSFIGTLAPKQKSEYLALRKELGNVWSAGGRQSVPVESEKKDEVAELQAIALSRGLVQKVGE